MPTDKEILFSIIEREIDNLTCYNPVLAMLSSTIKNKVLAFLTPYVEFFTEGEKLEIDMATSFVKREVQKKLEDFKRDFKEERELHEGQSNI